MAEFHEDWYSEFQLQGLESLVGQVGDLPGVLVEIGCWEGRSTVRIAQACSPQPLHAIDHWRGNVDEGGGHASVVAASQRDVYGTFLANVAPYPHVTAHCGSAAEVFSTWDLPVKFVHIDVGHTYEMTRDVIGLVLPHMVDGGFVCGDDYLTSHIGRTDLQGGVQRAVGELLPNHSVVGNLWYWRAVTPRIAITIGM